MENFMLFVSEKDSEEILIYHSNLNEKLPTALTLFFMRKVFNFTSHCLNIFHLLAKHRERELAVLPNA